MVEKDNLQVIISSERGQPMSDVRAITSRSQGVIQTSSSKGSASAAESFSDLLSSELSKDSAFEKAFAFVTRNSKRYVAGDNPMKFGIMQTTLRDYDPGGKIARTVGELDEEKAKQIYRKIWERAGCDRLPQPLSVIHFDAYVQRPRTAIEALRQSKGDPGCYMEVRKSLLKDLKSYPAYGSQWQNRIQQLAEYVSVKDAKGDPASDSRVTKDVAGVETQLGSAGQARDSGSDFESGAVFILKQEGSKTVWNDNGKGPSKFGILQSTLKEYDPRGEIVRHVKDLDEPKAKKIYKMIWDRAGCDDLPYPMNIIHFDTYIHRPRIANHALKVSDGDPLTYLKSRISFLQGMKSYRKYGNAWENRIGQLSQLFAEAPSAGLRRKL